MLLEHIYIELKHGVAIIEHFVSAFQIFRTFEHFILSHYAWCFVFYVGWLVGLLAWWVERVDPSLALSIPKLLLCYLCAYQ